MKTIEHIINTHEILLTCGTGGVGKTTIAATLGLLAAQQGKRCLVITIDPAKRLADALGIDALDHDISPIWPEHEEDAQHGLLDGMMLDTKSTFDRLIDRYAPDPATAERIMRNPLYRELSSLMTGSQEYMAMEALYELKHDHDYELIILDTPPSQHALDFFQAPMRLTNALHGSMLKLFLKPSLAAGKFGAKLLNIGSEAFMRVFGKMAGGELLREVSDLLSSSVSMFDGFEQRAQAVQTMLRAPSTSVITISTPEAHRIDDTIQFMRHAQQHQLHIVASIFNRCTPQHFAPTLAPLHATAKHSTLAQAFTSNAAHCATRCHHEQAQIRRCQDILGMEHPCIRIDNQAEHNTVDAIIEQIRQQPSHAYQHCHN